MRILASIVIYGGRDLLDELFIGEAIQNGSLNQIGTSRQTAEGDLWSYRSPWYQFNLERLNEELEQFLSAHQRLPYFLKPPRASLRHALLSLSPVYEEPHDSFGCVFEKGLLDSLGDVGLELEIAPAEVMPIFPFWTVEPMN